MKNKICVYFIISLSLFSEPAFTNDRFEEVYQKGGINALRDFLKPRTPNELRKLFQSEDEGDRIAFIKFAKAASQKVVENKNRDESLENLYFEGLSDSRLGFMALDDLFIASPRAVCAINLSRVTNYTKFLKKTEGKRYRVPLFSLDEDAEIKKLKIWYETTYLSSLATDPRNDDTINGSETKDGQRSETGLIGDGNYNKRVGGRNLKGFEKVEKKAPLTMILIIILGICGFISIVLLILRKRFFSVKT